MNDWSQGENAIALSTASFTIASITSFMIRLFRLFDFFYRHLATGDVHDFISQFQFLDLDNYQTGGLGTPYPDVTGYSPSFQSRITWAAYCGSMPNR